MVIHTYWEPLTPDGFPDGEEMLRLWSESWKRHGWIPVVHGISQASIHPNARVFNAITYEFPTVNPANYERACWRRWLVAAQTGGFWCDADLVNTGFKPRHALGEAAGKAPFMAWHEGDTPNCGLIGGPAAAFQSIFVGRVLAGMVPLTKENGRDHTSDMFLWQALHREGMFRSVRGVSDGYGKPGDWKLVHCSHHHAREAGLTQIEAMRKLVNAT